MIKTMFQECISVITDLVGHEYLYFDNAVQVKLTPHRAAFNVWAVCVSPANDLYIMDSDEEWHRLDFSDDNASYVIGSLYQRLKLMRLSYAKAS